MFVDFKLMPSSHLTLRPFLASYQDSGDSDGTTYLPNEIQYLRARFQPNVSDAVAVGLAWDGTAGPWTFKGEVDYLTGSDDVANLDSGPKQLLDVNDGDLSGYNLYLDVKRQIGPPSSKLGLVLGLGSGDDDPMSGDGNINKIRTNGFLYITEVWEDSVMPDEEGITPQGLGSPASRGYREFENTTLFQASYTWNINTKLTYLIYGAWIKATEKVFPGPIRTGTAPSNGTIAFIPTVTILTPACGSRRAPSRRPPESGGEWGLGCAVRRRTYTTTRQALKAPSNWATTFTA